MEKELNRAIQFLSEKITEGVTADEALKYSQAALNLANTISEIITTTE